MEKIDENFSQPSLHFSKALEEMRQFPLIQALAGRRSRRFCLGAEIPEGPLAFKASSTLNITPYRFNSSASNLFLLVSSPTDNISIKEVYIDQFF